MSEHKTTKQQFCNDLGIFHEDRAVIEINGKWFHILPSGEPAYTERYGRAEYFQNGTAWVMEESGRWKEIDKDGKEIKTK